MLRICSWPPSSPRGGSPAGHTALAGPEVCPALLERDGVGGQGHPEGGVCPTAPLARWAVFQTRGLPASALLASMRRKRGDRQASGARPLGLTRRTTGAHPAALCLPAADGPIRCDQLSLGLLWAQLFQDAHTQPGDVVAFDIYCGDLNFDTCSSGGCPGGGRRERDPLTCLSHVPPSP